MRKIEWIPWSLIAFFGLCLCVYFISIPNPDAYTPISVEITGTLIGFLVALSVAELINAKDKLEREQKITRALIEEIKGVKPLTPGEKLIFFSIDMWDMALQSNDLNNFNFEKLSEFRIFYRKIRSINLSKPIFDKAWAESDQAVLDELENSLKPLWVEIQEMADALINKYS